MLLRFIGEYTGKRTSITLCGVTFNGREPSEIIGEEAHRRLSNHPEFERVAPKEPEPETMAEAVSRKRGRPRKN